MIFRDRLACLPHNWLHFIQPYPGCDGINKIRCSPRAPVQKVKKGPKFHDRNEKLARWIQLAGSDRISWSSLLMTSVIATQGPSDQKLRRRHQTALPALVFDLQTFIPHLHVPPRGLCCSPARTTTSLVWARWRSICRSMRFIRTNPVMKAT